MALAQLRLLPMYLRLLFLPSTWAFTFSWAAVASCAVHWLRDGRPTGYAIYEILVLDGNHGSHRGHRTPHDHRTGTTQFSGRAACAPDVRIRFFAATVAPARTAS